MAKVLIVDDAVFMRATIKNLVEKEGYEVVGEAENGVMGVRKYKECRPDIVTLDITMPDMSGIEALKQIKQLDPRAKVVMVSAMGQEHMVKQAIMHGATTFIVKPFKDEQMLKTLAKIVDA